MQSWMSSSSGSTVASWHMQHSTNPFGAVYPSATVATPSPPSAPGSVVLYNPLAGLPTSLLGFGVTQRNPFTPGKQQHVQPVEFEAYKCHCLSPPTSGCSDCIIEVHQDACSFPPVFHALLLQQLRFRQERIVGLFKRLVKSK